MKTTSRSRALRLCCLLVWAACGLATPSCAKQPEPEADREMRYAVGFYNLENLFDTQHDAGKNDYEFLPDGEYRWTEEKYRAKLKNMARVLSTMGDKATSGHAAIIGVAEVENQHVMDDLMAEPNMRKVGFRYVHIEGNDKRGIDCAVIYDPNLFTVDDAKLVPYRDEEHSGYKTRGFLVVSGKLAGEKLHIVVCHWPSRATEEWARVSAGRQTKAVKDSLLKRFPGSKVIIMGDLNDDPRDRSMSEGLMCKYSRKGVGDTEIYNPWRDVHHPGTVANGTGTLTYQGKWNLFDQIVFTGTLLNGKKKLHYDGCEIFKRDYLVQQKGKYKGSPLRTHSGGEWLNGFSDHFPTQIYLIKPAK